MKNGLTKVVLLIDRSGSMESIKNDAEGGINNFINEQFNQEGELDLTVFDFDYTLERKIDSKVKPAPYMLIPRGGTALVDSMCKAIDTIGRELASLKESERPEKVVFVTVTDGGENSSGEFKSEDLKNRTTHQESVYKWQFVYLGANQDAFEVANSIGVNAANASNYVPSKFSEAMQYTSDNLVAYRSGLSRSLGYNDAQKADLETE